MSAARQKRVLRRTATSLNSNGFAALLSATMKKPAPSIWLEPRQTGPEVAASFVVEIAGLPIGKKLAVEFFEVDPPKESLKRAASRNQQSGDVKIGTVQGTVAPLPLATALMGVRRITLVPEKPPASPPSGKGTPVVQFFFPGTADPFVFVIPGEALDIDEGDFWEIQVRVSAPAMASPIMTIAHVRRSLEPAVARYRWHDGHRLVPYSDGALDPTGKAGAFADMLKAIADAEHFVFIVDWSFHPYFRPFLEEGRLMEQTIGTTLVRKAAAGKTVAIHTWDHTDRGAPDPQNDSGDEWLRALMEHLGMKAKPSKLRWRASSPSGIVHSHHQKFVVVDQPSKDGRRSFKVFFGGLDLTQGRLDWGDHPTSAHDERLASRRLSWGPSTRLMTNEWYNAETGGALDLPRQPWHDIHGCLEGPATWDFMREFVIRWAARPGSERGDGLAKSDDPVCELWKTVQDGKQWVQQYDPHDGPWAAQVVRSNVADRCAVVQQVPTAAARPLTDARPVDSEATILEMYRQAIDLADRFIYIENQYLIGSGPRWQTPRGTIANDLPERIVNKILSKKGQPFHVYVVTPLLPEGDPVGIGGVEMRNYEWRTIEYMLRALEAGIGKNWSDHLSLMFLAHWEPVAQERWSRGNRNARLRAHQRYMVYVHSKMMIVDDRFLIFGSANLNERSLAGSRDTEIACALWPGRATERVCTDQLRAFRKDLWAEHFGTVPLGADDPASQACVSACRKMAEANYMSFRALEANRQGHVCSLPAAIIGGNFTIGQREGTPEGPVAFPEPSDFLPDGDPTVDWWRWACRGSRLSSALGEIAE